MGMVSNSFKWLVFGSPKKPQPQVEEYREEMLNPSKPIPQKRNFFPDTMPDPISYPLPPVGESRQIKRLPKHLMPKRRFYGV